MINVQKGVKQIIDGREGARLNNRTLSASRPLAATWYHSFVISKNNVDDRKSCDNHSNGTFKCPRCDGDGSRRAIFDGSYSLKVDVWF
jgi:hypothetical protein